MKVTFDNPPSYAIGHCGVGIVDLSEETTTNIRVWTIRKQSDTLQLFCGQVEVVKINFAESSIVNCRTIWSLDFEIVQFVKNDEAADTASDFFREFADGKQKPKFYILSLNF